MPKVSSFDTGKLNAMKLMRVSWQAPKVCDGDKEIRSFAYITFKTNNTNKILFRSPYIDLIKNLSLHR